MDRAGEGILKFQQWSSRVDEEFWQHLASLKLDTIHLDDKPIPIQGYFAPCSYANLSNHLQLRAESFPAYFGEVDPSFHGGNRNQCPAPGTLYLTNTEEEFRAIDKSALLKNEAKKLWNDICSGKAIEDCRLLNRFFLISYADLKKWRFYYCFAFPALVLNPPAICSVIQPASEVFTAEESAAVSMACQRWRASSSSTGIPFFLLDVSETTVRARPLKEWSDCQQGGKVIAVFYDPCHLHTNPGWPLRNFLTLAAIQWGQKHMQVLCYRERRGQPDLGQCLLADVTLSDYPGQLEVPIPVYNGLKEQIPDAVGWEFTARQKDCKMVDLASSMDPVRLAESAADLNLKLMRWRLLPSLDIDLLSNTRCLLLGAGTLGCQVARGLMAWGIRHITLVDCGHVAMSNPVRQSLYSFEDCLNGGKMKAEAAAESLRHIFPGMEAKGVQIIIPMPGHGVMENEVPEVDKACKLLHDLVDKHDVVFLLTDTRESRWLPTLLCANANKIAINAALAFDTFLVMRHGAAPSVHDIEHADSRVTRLGCYFCNDVVAPENSTSNRTLDQQCTVTRPSVAPIAAALAVELTISLLHHPLKINAPADVGSSPMVEPLGILPHQIRGLVANFSQQVFVGNAFSKCTACSPYVLNEYRERGFDFLRQVFNSPTYLEDLTGLTDLIDATNKVHIDWEDD